MAGETEVLEENRPAAVVQIPLVVPTRIPKDTLQNQMNNCNAANKLHLKM
jgi:hypothetical protein